MISLFIPALFGEHYQVLAQGQKAISCGIVVDTNDAARLFSILTRELMVPTEQWRGILLRLDVAIPPNFYHATDIYQEVIRLFLHRKLILVKIPRLEQLPVIATGDGWGYCFIRGPERHPSLSYSPMGFDSLQDVQHWLGLLDKNTLNIFAKHHSVLAPVAATHLYIFIAERIINKEILVYKIPVAMAAPPVKAVELLPATAIDREVPLTPETKPAVKSASTLGTRKGVPPASLDDAANRLVSMKPEIAEHGHQPKYTDAQLIEQAQAGAVAKERYHVRFMEKGHQWDGGDTLRDENNLTGKLGKEFTGETGTGPRYWSTTFDQIEDADTDAQLICQKLGIDYNPAPNQGYVLVIIDTEKSTPLTGCECVAATFNNISEFSNRELPRNFPKEFTDQVMNAEHQAYYKSHYQAARKDFLDSDWSTDTDDFSDYLTTTNLTDTEKELLIQRMKMHKRIGNNQHYLGNGLTKNKIAKSCNEFGAVETHNFERSPTNLQLLKDKGAIKIIDL